jgi:ParB family chromosome partitioning protein
MSVRKIGKGGANAAYAAAAAPSAVDALFGTSADFPQVVEINLNRVRLNPDQPRKVFDGAAIESLAESIAESGLKQPILVTQQPDGWYQLIAGERRLRAHQHLGRPTIFAILTAGDPAEVALIENLQRVDLNLIEMADAFARMAGRPNYTHERLARLCGINKTEVTRVIGLRRLTDRIRSDYLGSFRDAVSKAILFELADLEPADQEALWKRVIAGEMKHAELRQAKRDGQVGEKGPRPAVLRLVTTSRRIARDIEAVRDAIVSRQAQLEDRHREELCTVRRLIDELLATEPG